MPRARNAKSLVLVLEVIRGSGVSPQNTPRKDLLASYVEIDFPEITTKKAMSIRKNKDLSLLLGRPEDVKLAHGGTALHAPAYHLIPLDLRLPPGQALGNALNSDAGAGLLSPNLPTLLLFECVLVYMRPAESEALIQWFVDYFSAGDDVMLNNLRARNVDLPGAESYPTFDSLLQRFLRHGFDASHALTLREIRRTYISHQELERISQLEMLDEIEELELVLQHYAITWGVKLYERNGQSLKANWKGWALRAPEDQQ
ncbi:unnamed protein product [Somion occarium]|uniref:Leucine carboxyl methyltransferase 1 n=1 Tax=Somion occarium TaxID=3059160 RepID=A0ABP1DU97_9APHY